MYASPAAVAARHPVSVSVYSVIIKLYVVDMFYYYYDYY